MTRLTEHLHFALLMIPTLALLAAAAVSMADLSLPPEPPLEVVAVDELFEHQP